jgi:acyl carrier protein
MNADPTAETTADKTAAPSKIRRAFYDIVPDAESETMNDDLPLRQQFDMDSVDFLNFIIKLHETFGVEIPEADYRHLTTVNAIAQYLRGRASTAPSAGGAVK